MDHEEEQLFRQLADDSNIAAAVAEHETACAQRPAECPVCHFFNHLHELRHFAEACDPGKLVDLAISIPDFLDDSMVIIQFLSEANRYFLAEKIDWGEESHEWEDEDD